MKGDIFKGRTIDKTNNKTESYIENPWDSVVQKEKNLILPTACYLGHLISARGSVIINHLNVNLVAFRTCSVQEITARTNNMLAEYTVPKGTFLPYSKRTIMSSKVLLPKQDSGFVL